MVKLEDLYKAYYIARSNKRRSEDSVEYEINLEANLIRLYNEINDRSLSPSAYTFVTTKPRPREVFACEMGMRVVHHYIDIRLRPLIEKRLTNRTFNNRVGFGQNVAINTLVSDIYEVSKGFTQDAWIIKMDLQGYFPNANQDIVFKQLANIANEDYHGDDKEDLLYMIRSAIYSYPTLHCYKKSPHWKWTLIDPKKSLFTKPYGVGGAIGHLIWQNAMNYYLNDFDHYIVDELKLHYVRFVDDMVFVVENKDAFLPMIETFRKMLNEYGCELHPKKFYCQHYTKGVEFIGAVIKLDRIYPTKRIVRNARKAILSLNKCIRPSKINSFIASVNSYLGILKTRNGYASARDLLDIISPKWWEYVEFDKERVCVVAKEGYKFRQLIKNKYQYDSKRKRKRAQCAVRKNQQLQGLPDKD